MENEELELVKKAQAGDSYAMEALIIKYMRLARAKAHKYFLIGGSYDDLYQEGLMGIFKAIRDFDPSKNDNLSSFVSMCINSQITDAVRADFRAKNKALNEAVSIDNVDGNLPSVYIYDPVRNYMEKEGIENFYLRLSELVKPDKIEVLKYYFEGYTYVEIARILNLENVRRVDNILFEIKKKIKEHEDLFLG